MLNLFYSVVAATVWFKDLGHLCGSLLLEKQVCLQLPCLARLPLWDVNLNGDSGHLVSLLVFPTVVPFSFPRSMVQEGQISPLCPILGSSTPYSIALLWLPEVGDDFAV